MTLVQCLQYHAVDGFFSFMVTQELVDVVTYSLTIGVQPTITAVAFEALLGV